MRRLLLLLATVLATVTATAVSAAMLAGPAAADPPHCHQEATKNPDGSITYHLVCEHTHPGQPGTPGGGQEEDCGQDQVTPGPGDGPYFCSGGFPCAYTTNVVPLALPTTDPEPGKEWQVMICHKNGVFTKEWVQTGGTQPRPLIVQAQEAYGNLAPPGAQVRHSPDTRGIVGLATWLWLAPGTFGELRGSSAEGLVAVARPDGTRWTTGDGGSISCTGAGTPYGSAGGSDCTHTYRKASARYSGTVTRTWAVHYEQGGNPIDIPGAPDTLTANTGWALTVAEAQVLTGSTPSPGR
jgi:hypothetical protein